MATERDGDKERGPARPSRAERLQAQLRENLKKRKEQGRARRGHGDKDDDDPERD